MAQPPTIIKTRAAPAGNRQTGSQSRDAEIEAGIEIREIKYINNIVEQDHRVIGKGQLLPTGKMCPARQFYSLTG
jgi:transposase-like protein